MNAATEKRLAELNAGKNIYTAVEGRKFTKIVATDSSGYRYAVEFVERSSGQRYRAESWSKRGRML